jgi:hypothetical protein
MAARDIAAALERLKSVLRRRPGHARLVAAGGLCVVHGDLYRDGRGSRGHCAGNARGAGTKPIHTRGMLGLAGLDGEPVSAGPRDMQMLVRICAQGVSEQRLRALVEESYRRSPTARALEDRLPVALRIEVDVS